MVHNSQDPWIQGQGLILTQYAHSACPIYSEDLYVCFSFLLYIWDIKAWGNFTQSAHSACFILKGKLQY